jgi:hypothetical protein
MTPETYQQRMAEMQISRGQLETGIKQDDSASVSAVKPRTILPKGLLPEPKVDEPDADWSHLNPKQWFTHKKNGTRGGRKTNENDNG